MLDLRAEIRQSRGDLKPRNVRKRCPKSTPLAHSVERTQSGATLSWSGWARILLARINGGVAKKLTSRPGVNRS